MDSLNLNFGDQKQDVNWNGTINGSNAKWGKQVLNMFLGVSWGFGALLSADHSGTHWAHINIRVAGQDEVISLSLPTWEMTCVGARPSLYRVGHSCLPLGFHHPLPLVTHTAFYYSDRLGSPASGPSPLLPPPPEGLLILFAWADLCWFLRSQQGRMSPTYTHP